MMRFSSSACCATRTRLGESPLWDSDAGLRWLDVDGQVLLTLNHDQQTHVTPLSRKLTAIELSTDGRLVAVATTGFGTLDPMTGHVDEIVRVLDDETISMNDAAIDPHGRCWAGSAVRDGSARGALFSFDGSVATTRLDGVGMSNGLDWSIDGDELYHVDTTAGTLTAWEYDRNSGGLRKRRLVRAIPKSVGLPDGLTVDADGNIWLAVWGTGQVWNIDPCTGTTLAVVDVPARNPTSCTFGGPDLSTLYVTTAKDDRGGGGLLCCVKVPVVGTLARRFAR